MPLKSRNGEVLGTFAKENEKEDLFQLSLKTPVGRLYLISDENFLLEVVWEKEKESSINLKKAKSVSKQIPVLVQAKEQLEEYFAGKRKIFSVPLNLNGTDFQNSVWKTLALIPYGETWSYQQQANQMKRASAVRAVAAANGKNPLPIFIPCHRVIGSDGNLRGYNGSVEFKKILLRHEGHAIA